jgi:hypothetical protein
LRSVSQTAVRKLPEVTFCSISKPL